MIEGDLAGPNLVLWANGGSKCSISFSPKGLDDSYHDHIVSVSPVNCAKSAVNRKGDRSFALYTDHATIPWHEGSTTSTLWHSWRCLPQSVAGYDPRGRRKKGPKEWFGKGTVLVLLPSTANSNDHNWLCSEPWSGNRSLYQKEDPWGVGEEQPLSFYSHCSGVVHVHMWQPTISHPSAHYGQAKSDLQHGIGTMV